ncbi:MAG: tetratricopeptide repeat protein [Janthinobacterium lividum]
MSAPDANRLQAALADYDAGNLAAAQPVLIDLAGRYPNHAETQAAAGMVLAEQGSIAAAIPYLKRAHELTPHSAELTLNLALAQKKMGNTKGAEALLLAASKEHADNGSVRAALAQSQVENGNLPAALESFARADVLLRAQGQPIDADLRYDWAVALLRADRANQAIAALQPLPQAGSTAAIQELLGEAEEKTSQYKVALEHFKKAAELEQSEPNLYAYGNELLQHWTFPSAIEIFQFALARFPSSSRLRLALGIAFYGNGNYDQAVPIFEAMLAAEPDNARTADLLGRSCSALTGTPQAGCASLQQFAQAHPANAPASLFAAVNILHQPADLQNSAAANTLLRNALKADPKLADAWYELGALQQSQNQWEESSASLQQAIAARPAYPEAHYRLARAYARIGKREQAQQEIALQQKYAAEAKTAENQRMQEVMKFLTTSN